MTSWTAQQSHGKPFLTYLLIAFLIIAPLQAGAAESAPTEQPQKQKNRSSGNAVAIAAAAAAAGIAAASCMKLYQSAKEARAAGDIAGAERLEAQAAMQCAQAAQNAANAGQNQGGQDQITAANMTPGEQNTAQTTPTTTPTPTEKGPTAPLTEETPTPTTEEQVVAENSQAVAPTTFEQPNSEVTGGQGATGGVSAAQTTLPQIPREGITYDEAAGNPSANGFAANGAGGSNGFGTPGGLANNSLFDSVGGSKAAEELQALAHGKIGRGRGKSGEAEGADSSGGSEGEKGSTFGSMLSSLMGGPAADQIASTTVGSAAGFGAESKTADKAPNIFEYANYRFRKLNREGEVRVAAKVERKLASTKK